MFSCSVLVLEYSWMSSANHLPVHFVGRFHGQVLDQLNQQICSLDEPSQMRNVVGEPSLGHHKWSIFGQTLVLHGASWCFIQDVPVFQEESNLRGITIGQIGALMCLAHSDLQYWKPSILLVDVGYKCHYITMRSLISLVVSHYSHYIPMISPLSLHFIPMFFHDIPMK